MTACSACHAGAAEPGGSLPGNAGPLLQVMKAALDSGSFMVNGGRLGFPCAHAYPHSLVEGITEEVSGHPGVRYDASFNA